MCLETGAFVMNYAGCHACKQRRSIKSVNREVSEDEQDTGDYEETVTFHRQRTAANQQNAAARCIHSTANTHTTLSVPLLLPSDTCSVCSHHIAEHYYTFTVVHPPHNPGAVQQDYLMDCVLCGRAADTSHTLNDVEAHSANRQQHQHAVSETHASRVMPATMSQQQHATMTQLIGRMEVVSAVHVQHAAVLSSQPVDVADDEWS